MKIDFTNYRYLLAFSLIGLSVSNAYCCDLKVVNAWIREAPPSAMTLAGYARVTNTSDKPLEIKQVTSSTFMEIQLHESTIQNGVAGMRLLTKLIIAAGASVFFAPDGKHFMLMGLQHPLKAGDKVPVEIKDSSGCVTHAEFIVSKGAQ